MAATHVVVAPFQDHGHTIPAMHLSNKLAAHYGLSVTVFCSAESSYNRAISLVQEGVEEQVKVVYTGGSMGLMNMRAGNEEMEANFRQLLSDSPPACVIVDVMISSSFVSTVASELGIPRYNFYTSCAAALGEQFSSGPRGGRGGRNVGGRGVLDLGWGRGDRGRGGPRGGGRDGERRGRGEGRGFGGRGEGRGRGGRGEGRGRGGRGEGRGRGGRGDAGPSPTGPPGCAGVLINTFDELEGGKVDELPTEIKVLGVGPLLPAVVFDENAFKVLPRANTGEEIRCLEFLDKQPPSSVLYVSFGSRAYLSGSQVTELAQGLEASGQRFLWLLPPPPNQPADIPPRKQLPDGFEERTAKQGIILSGWAPQLLILAHPSTVAFLTHCGWNSTLESLCLGKPMLAWPLMADQSTICDFLVHTAWAAVEVEKEEDGLVDKSEIERVLRLVMEEEEGHELRTRACELREGARKAVSAGGSSQNHLDHFVGEITHKLKLQEQE